MNPPKIKPTQSTIHLAVFQDSRIRRAWHKGEWWFVVADMVGVLSNSVQPEGYLKSMRHNKNGMGKEWAEIGIPVPVQTAGGVQPTKCVNIAGLFRLVQFIPAPHAAPFKRWLAKMGYARVLERVTALLAEDEVKRVSATKKVVGKKSR